MEPNLKISLRPLEGRLAGTRPGQGGALQPPPESGQRGAEVAKTPDERARGSAQDTHFEVFLGNFVTGSKSSQSSVPAKFSRLNGAIVHTPSPAVIRFSLISDGPPQDHLHLERAVAGTGGAPWDHGGP